MEYSELIIDKNYQLSSALNLISSTANGWLLFATYSTEKAGGVQSLLILVMHDFHSVFYMY